MENNMKDKMKKYCTWTTRFVLIAAIFAMGILMGTAPCSAAQPDDEVFAFAGGKTHIMKRVPSPSGEKYEAADDPETFFWSEGAEAVLKIRGRQYSKYVLLRDLTGDDFILTVDGKNYRMEQAVSASGALYKAAGDPETTFWSKGESVTLVVAGEEYSGYDTWRADGGIWLADQEFPTEIQWKVVSIDDSPLLPNSAVTITFHADGSVSGKASVNTYNASWMATGNKLVITRGVATKMAGSPELMDQENAFLKLLSEINSFQFLKDGLTLGSESGAKILLKQ
ncbi:MAG: META domain-containing protein [Synergistaceae bacterium]|jgi:putative lipoprotein|nr:META domain-containing protein [Synergistaceae bacterium]